MYRLIHLINQQNEQFSLVEHTFAGFYLIELHARP